MPDKQWIIRVIDELAGALTKAEQVSLYSELISELRIRKEGVEEEIEDEN